MPPLNDAFASAIEIVGASGSVTGDNTGATEEAGEPQSGTAGKTIWYKWTAPNDAVPRTLKLNTYSTVAVGDTTLGVFTGAAVGALVEVGFNDDADVGSLSAVSFIPSPGVTYFIQLGTFSGGEEGEIVLSWETVAFTPPAEPSPVGSLVLVDYSGNPETGSSGLIQHRDKVTGAVLGHYPLEAGDGDAAGVTGDGYYLAFHAQDPDAEFDRFKIYREPNTFVAEVALPAIPGGIHGASFCTHPDDFGRFYLAQIKELVENSTATTLITRVSQTGEILDQWELPPYPGAPTPGDGVVATKFAPSPDGTKLYMTGNAGHPVNSERAINTIYCFDLVNEVWLAQVFETTAPIGADPQGAMLSGFIVLPNGELLVADGWWGGATNPREMSFIYRLDADGVVLDTFVWDDTSVAGVIRKGPQLQRGLDGSSFWARERTAAQYGGFPVFETFREYDSATGAILNEFTAEIDFERLSLDGSRGYTMFVHLFNPVVEEEAECTGEQGEAVQVPFDSRLPHPNALSVIDFGEYADYAAFVADLTAKGWTGIYDAGSYSPDQTGIDSDIPFDGRPTLGYRGYTGAYANLAIPLTRTLWYRLWCYFKPSGDGVSCRDSFPNDILNFDRNYRTGGEGDPPPDAWKLGATEAVSVQRQSSSLSGRFFPIIVLEEADESSTRIRVWLDTGALLGEITEAGGGLRGTINCFLECADGEEELSETRIAFLEYIDGHCYPIPFLGLEGFEPASRGISREELVTDCSVAGIMNDAQIQSGVKLSEVTTRGALGLAIVQHRAQLLARLSRVWEGVEIGDIEAALASPLPVGDLGEIVTVEARRKKDQAWFPVRFMPHNEWVTESNYVS